jgi:hypothetical protein
MKEIAGRVCAFCGEGVTCEHGKCLVCQPCKRCDRLPTAVAPSRSPAPKSERMKALDDLAKAEYDEGIYDAGLPGKSELPSGEASDKKGAGDIGVSPAPSGGAAGPSERDAPEKFFEQYTASGHDKLRLWMVGRIPADVFVEVMNFVRAYDRAAVPQAAPPETTPYMPTLDQMVKDLMDDHARESRWLYEAATEADCDLDQVANVIRKLKSGAAAVPAPGRELKVLASALKKVLPPALLNEVISHCDGGFSEFLEFLRA